MFEVEGSWDFPYRSELESTLKQYELNREDICLHGSLVLQAAGIRDNNDVDLILTSDARKSLPGIRAQIQFAMGNTVTLSNAVSVSAPEKFDWIGISDEEIINDPRYHVVVDGYKLLRPELYLLLKYYKDREKDHRDIRQIEASMISEEWWDWNLVSSPPPWRDNRFGSSPIEKLVWAIRSNGVQWTIKKILSKLSPVARSTLLTTVFNLDCTSRRGLAEDWWKTNKLDGYHDTIVPVVYLLSQQYIDGSYAVSEIFDQFDSIEAFSEGTVCDVPIVVNGNNIVVEGFDQLAEAVSDGTEYITVAYQGQGTPRSTTKASNAETRTKAFFEYGVYFYCILWPPAFPFADEMISDIESRVNVVTTTRFDLDEQLPGFLRNIYSKDDRAYNWKTEKKINLLKGTKNPITVVVWEIPRPQFRLEEGTTIAETSANLKSSLRREYSDRLNNYEYDTLIHATDNFVNNRHVHRLLQSYGVRLP